MNNHFIPLVLLLVFLATWINLYFLPRMGRTPRMKYFFDSGIDPIQRSLCSLRGMKIDEEDDCREKCGGEGFKKIKILESDHVVMLNQKLDPGTYCVPEGMSACNQNSSVAVFSSNGWFCAPRNRSVWNGNYRVACVNREAKHPDLNQLWDHSEHGPIRGYVRDYYELMPNGSMRYGCKCESLDNRGNRMINILPFTCAVDYCTRDLEDAPAHVGWNEVTKSCECGPYPRGSNPIAPCLREKSSSDETTGLLTGRVDCMTRFSMEPRPLHCPPGVDVLRFEKYIWHMENPVDFLAQHRENVGRTLLEIP